MAELKIDSSSIDSIQRRTYEVITRVANDKRVPFIIVGASARDLVMHHGYGADIQRATRDIDLAVQVEDWDAFHAIKSSLVAEGYRETKASQRSIDDQDIPLDIVPFGPLENPDAKIKWPDGTSEMGVMGFKEALDHADRVIVVGDPSLELPVASPVGLVLLKLVAWSERDPQIRKKDAADILYLLHNYENIPTMTDRLYDQHLDVMESYDWDSRHAGAHILGLDVAGIAEPKTLLLLREILDDESLERFCEDAGADPVGGNETMVEAFCAGLLG
ncbi:nucleotidyl transferase AbiEii/AbiGii toxin family protein [Marinobacter bohaiensis]|uniref:nucleotidyl transferase AbiEii/AbiGii toxin family protein n=1 Tax=Marinobacter bohaiensis TaxID=2201898 RepID=UPI000DAD9B3F|nr:nucleotidyl transferase AbiEii/AbiGii toxin family protein [Marinobacter bohaiensis]